MYVNGIIILLYGNLHTRPMKWSDASAVRVELFGGNGSARSRVRFKSVVLLHFRCTSVIMAMETETPPEEEKQEEVLLPDTTIVTHCIYKNDLERLVKSFEDDTDPYKDSINELMNERDYDGKSPLDLAASFGRVDICRELLKRGADLTVVTDKGLYKSSILTPALLRSVPPRLKLDVKLDHRLTSPLA